MYRRVGLGNLHHQRITGLPAKSLEISNRIGVGCNDFQGLTALQLRQRFLGPQNRQRAF